MLLCTWQICYNHRLRAIPNYF